MMEEETLSETTRKYYVLRYAVIGILLLSSVGIFSATLVVRPESMRGHPESPPPEVMLAESDAQTKVSSLPGWSSFGLLAGGLLLLVGISYATYTRFAMPGFMKGYVEEQAPFWPITRRSHEYTIQMDGTSILVQFFPKRRSRWGALRIELPLSTKAHTDQVKAICEQNGVSFSEADNLISTITAPEEFYWKLLMFSRIIQQINTLGE